MGLAGGRAPRCPRSGWLKGCVRPRRGPCLSASRRSRHRAVLLGTPGDLCWESALGGVLGGRRSQRREGLSVSGQVLGRWGSPRGPGRRPPQGLSADTEEGAISGGSPALGDRWDVGRQREAAGGCRETPRADLGDLGGLGATGSHFRRLALRCQRGGPRAEAALPEGGRSEGPHGRRHPGPGRVPPRAPSAHRCGTRGHGLRSWVSFSPHTALPAPAPTFNQFNEISFPVIPETGNL